MCFLKKSIWAVLIAGATGVPAFAQGGMSSGGASGGGLSSGSAGGAAGGSSSGTALATLNQTPQITAPSTAGGNTGNTVSASNFLSMYYANPYYQGVLTNQQSGNNSPGGFGAPLFNNTGSTGGGAIGYAGTSSTSTSSTGGRTAGGGGGRGSSSSSNSAIIFPVQTQMTYQCLAQFPIEPVPTSQLQSDLVAMIQRSSTKYVSNPSAIQVSADVVNLTTPSGRKEAKNIVTLRGTVKDFEEKSTIESMVRMTPGVDGVKSDLKIAAKP